MERSERRPVLGSVRTFLRVWAATTVLAAIGAVHLIGSLGAALRELRQSRRGFHENRSGATFHHSAMNWVVLTFVGILVVSAIVSGLDFSKQADGPGVIGMFLATAIVLTIVLAVALGALVAVPLVGLLGSARAGPALPSHVPASMLADSGSSNHSTHPDPARWAAHPIRSSSPAAVHLRTGQ